MGKRLGRYKFMVRLRAGFDTLVTAEGVNVRDAFSAVRLHHPHAAIYSPHHAGYDATLPDTGPVLTPPR